MLNNIWISLKCCKDCIKKINDCKSHTAKVRQFESARYIHQGKERKNIALVDKMVKIDELVGLLKLKSDKGKVRKFEHVTYMH